MTYEKVFETQLDFDDYIGKPEYETEECAIQKAFDEAKKAGKLINYIHMSCSCSKCRKYCL